MPGKELMLGPFAGGLNLRDSPEQVPNAALPVLTNLDVRPDGTLVPRRGMQRRLAANNNGVGFQAPLGTSTDSFGNKVAVVGNANFSDTTDLYCANSNTAAFGGFWQRFTCPASGSTALPVANSCCDYQGKTYFGTSRGLWYGGGGFTGVIGQTGGGAVSFNQVTGPDSGIMGSGTLVIIGIIRDRLFAYRTGSPRIYYSKATDPTTFTVPDGGFFDVDPVSTSAHNINNEITSCVVQQDRLYIFKRSRTYVFTFGNDPGAGSLVKISVELGADSALLFENVIYLVNNRSVYRFVNNTFIDMAPQLYLPQFYVSGLTFFASIVMWGKILVVQIPQLDSNGNPNWRWFALNLESNAWSQYMFNQPNSVAPNLESGSVESEDNNGNRYIIFGGTGYTPPGAPGVGGSTEQDIYSINYAHDSGGICDAVTNSLTNAVTNGYAWASKYLSFGSIDRYKRFYWAKMVYRRGIAPIAIQNFTEQVSFIADQYFTTYSRSVLQASSGSGRLVTKSFRFRTLQVAHTFFVSAGNVNLTFNERLWINSMSVYVAVKQDEPANT